MPFPSTHAAALMLAALVVLLSTVVAQTPVSDDPINFIKVNCAGPEILPIGFLADENYFFALSTGDPQAFDDPDAPVVPTTWGEPYRTHRYSIGGTLAYSFPIPDGLYTVGLMFIEQFEGAGKAGGRLMDLLINDVLMDTDIDVWKAAGGKLYEPYYLEKQGVPAVNGTMTITLAPVVENPMLSGIVISGKNAASILWETSAPSETIDASTTAASSEAAPLVTPADEEPGPTPVVEILPSPPADVAEVAITPPTAMAPVETPATEPARFGGPGRWNNVDSATGQPIARHEACALFAEGVVFNIGGRGQKATSVYDPLTKTWTTRSGPPQEVNHMQCAYYNGKIYIGGSWYGQFPFEKEHASTWVYNIATDQWNEEPGLPMGRRRGGGTFVEYNGKLYLSHGAIGGHGAHATTTGLFDVYNPVTKQWQALPSAPNPRDHTTGAVVNGKLCVAGGRDGGVNDFWNANIGPVDCYDFSLGVWMAGANLPVPRGGTMAGATCDGRIMVAGGEGKTPQNQGGQAFERVDFYNVATNTFEAPSTMTSPRHGSGAAVTSCGCGDIYIPSGSAGLGGGPEVTTMDRWSVDGEGGLCV